jgi:dethiobiotin synthetase
MPAIKLSMDQLKKIKNAGGVFITGTDTDVGKTFISTLLLDYFQESGLSAYGLKPLASGCLRKNAHLQSEDALNLMSHSSVKLAYSEVNPITIEEPISPHFVNPISVNDLYQTIKPNLNKADICLIEGAGGWMLPLNEKETLADFAIKLNFPIILVVGLKLGCLNHSQLTAAHMESQGAPILGWIANNLDPNYLYPEKSIEFLAQKLSFPLIDVIQYQTALKFFYQ